MRKTLEQRLASLEEMVAEIHAAMVMGEKIIPGEAEYQIVLKEALKGNVKPLSEFKRRGGVIPVPSKGGNSDV